MKQQLDALYHRWVVAVFEKQMRLADGLASAVGQGAVGWHFPGTTPAPSDTAPAPLGLSVACDWDVRSGRLLLAGVDFQAQILGLQSHSPAAWVWAWHETPSDIPESFTAASRQLREYGSTEGIPEFVAGAVPAGSLFSGEQTGVGGHGLAVIAMGIFGFDAYYPVPHDGGTTFVLIQDDRLRIETMDPFAKVLTVFPQSLRGFPVSDHKAALLGYLEYCGFQPAVVASAVSASLDGREIIDAEFDGWGRLSRLIATIDGRRRVMFGGEDAEPSATADPGRM